MRTLNNADIMITPTDRPGAFVQSGHHDFHKAKRTQVKPKARKARRRPTTPIFTPVQKIAGASVGVVALLMTLFVILHSGLPLRLMIESYDQILSASASIGFKVSDISVTGRERTPVEDILSAIGMGRNAPILGINLDDTKARLELIPSVKAAIVERRLPDVIRITLIERRPIALWQHDGVFMLVDKDGHQFPGSTAGFQNLPLIVGEGAPAASPALFSALGHEPGLVPRIKAAIRVGSRRWNLRLDDAEHGLEARLPETEMEPALHQLAELEKNRSLTNRHVEMVDLRMGDRMVVKTAPEPNAIQQTATQPASTLPLNHKEGG